MVGTREGALKAAQTNLRLHGKDFYREIGRKGGQNGHTGGFKSNPELARIAGAKGGSLSMRGFKMVHKSKKYIVYKSEKTGKLYRKVVLEDKR